MLFCVHQKFRIIVSASSAIIARQFVKPTATLQLSRRSTVENVVRNTNPSSIIRPVTLVHCASSVFIYARYVHHNWHVKRGEGSTVNLLNELPVCLLWWFGKALTFIQETVDVFVQRELGQPAEQNVTWQEYHVTFTGYLTPNWLKTRKHFVCMYTLRMLSDWNVCYRDRQNGSMVRYFKQQAYTVF